MNKFNNSIYRKRINKPEFDVSQLNKDNAIENFKFLLQLIKLTTKTTQVADLRLVGLAKESGKTMMSKNIVNEKNYLITKSISGIFEKKRKI